MYIVFYIFFKNHSWYFFVRIPSVATIISARFSIKLVYLQFKYGSRLISKHSAGVKWTLETWRGIFSNENNTNKVFVTAALSCVRRRPRSEHAGGLDSAWCEFPRWVHSPLQTWKKHRLTRCAQTALFHFLRLPCCLSNKAETNAGGLLNYERWARVILQMKSKVTGFRMSVLLEFLKKPAAFSANLRRIISVCFSLSRLTLS